jgi:hypothetical protein
MDGLNVGRGPQGEFELNCGHCDKSCESQKIELS